MPRPVRIPRRPRSVWVHVVVEASLFAIEVDTVVKGKSLHVNAAQVPHGRLHLHLQSRVARHVEQLKPAPGAFAASLAPLARLNTRIRVDVARTTSAVVSQAALCHTEGERQ